MEGDEGGVLGGLPRSRPGTRSDKRERPAAASDRAAEQAERRDSAAAREGGAGETPRDKRETTAEPAPERAGSGPLAGALGAATQVAATGLRVATAVPREVLRRLPRP
jgi:hypothetical protein